MAVRPLNRINDYLLSRIDGDQLALEEAHFQKLNDLPRGISFEIIKYLYDRLNIIDSKVSGLLGLNALILSVVSIGFALAGIIAGDNGVELPLRIDWWEFLLYTTGPLLLILSSIFCFYMLQLRFDHVTSPIPPELVAKCTCTRGPDFTPRSCPLHPRCQYAAVALVPRTMEDYKTTFFRITMLREGMLRNALLLTLLAGIAVFCAIMYIAFAKSLVQIT